MGEDAVNMTLWTAIVLALLVGATAAYVFLPQQTAAALIAFGRALAGLRTRSVDIPGFRIAFVEGGSGEPLVLLHGIGGDKDNWTYISLFLRRHYRLIVPDLPGFGESSKPPGVGYGVEEQVERLRSFLRRIGIERAHFGGNSMGGLIASHYAVRYPAEVASLWLLGTAYVASAKPSEGFERLERGERNPLFAETEAEFDALLRFVMGKPPFVPRPLKRALAKVQMANYALNLQIFDELRARMVPLEETLAGFTTPTLIVWGGRDRVFDSSSAEILHRVMPASRFIVMPGIGHVPMLEAPYGVARDYIAFRREIAAGALLSRATEAV